MSVKLTIEIEGAVGPQDKNILTGATMILMALAGDAVAATETPDGEDVAAALATLLQTEPEVPAPCGVQQEGTGLTCQGVVGHRGRHLFRKVAGAAHVGVN